MAIDISFTTNTSELVRGTEKVKKSLDDIGDELRDVADEFDKSGREADRSLDKVDDALKDTGKSADRFEDDVRDAFRKAADHADAGSKKIGADTKAGFDRASRSTEEFRDEARQNLSETVSSFRGDVEDIPQILQDITGGVSSNLSALGGIMAAGVAAAIGIAVGKMQQLAEENTEAKENAADLAGAYIDAANTIAGIDFADVIRDWGMEVNEDQWWKFWADDAETNFEKVKRLAEEAGVDTSDAIRGMSGPLEDATEQLAELTKEEERLAKAAQETNGIRRDGMPSYTDSALAAQEQLKSLRELKDGVEENRDAHEDAREIEGLYKDSVEGSAEAVRDKVDALDELSATLTDSIGSELDYLDQLDETTEAIEKNGESLDRKTKKGRDNWRSLIDLKDAALDQAAADLEAGEAADVVAGKIAAQREEFIKAAEAAGATKEEAKKLADQWGLTPKEVSTKVTAETKDAEDTVDRFVKKGRVATVSVTANTSEADRYIAGLNGRTVRVNVQARPGQSTIA